MDIYETLRRQAQDKRDSIILEARQDYRRAKARIRQLQRQVSGGQHTGGRNSKQKSVYDLVLELMPREKVFTSEEMTEILSGNFPARTFYIQTVRATISCLVREKKIQRVRRHGYGLMFASADYKGPDVPYGTMSMVGVAEVVLRETGPKRTVELVMAMRERGYRTDLEVRTMANSLGSALIRYPQRFQRVDDKKWAVVESAKNAG